MPTASVSDRLKQLVLNLSSDPDELYRYSQNPAAYLRRRRFSKEVIDAVTQGGRSFQPLLSSPRGAAPPVFLVIGVKGYRSVATRKKKKKA